MDENITLTVDERTELNQLRAFKEYFDNMYGQGYDVIAWKGDREPFEDYHHDAMAEYNKAGHNRDEKADKNTFAEFRFYIDMEEGKGTFYKDGEAIAFYYGMEDTIRFTNGTFTSDVKSFDEAKEALKEICNVDNNPLWLSYADLSGHLEINGQEIAQFDGFSGEVKFNGGDWEYIGKGILENIREYIYHKIGFNVEKEVDNSIDFANTIDETAEVMTENGKINVMLALTDDKYDAILNRTALLADAGVTFREAVEESDATFNVYVDFYPDGNIEMSVFMQSDDYGWKDAEVPLSDAEKAQLCDDLERVAQCRYHATTKELMKEALDNIDLEGVETFSIDLYQENKNMAFILNDEIYTVNVVPLPPYTACIDINNNPDALRELQEKEYAIATGDTVSSGFVDYPVVVFNVKKLEEMYNGEVKDYEEKAHVTHADHQKAIVYYKDIVSAQKPEKDNSKETVEREE